MPHLPSWEIDHDKKSRAMNLAFYGDDGIFCSMLALLFLLSNLVKQQHKSTSFCTLLYCHLLLSNGLTWYRWVKLCTSVRGTMPIVFITITKYAGFAAQEKGNNITGEVSHKADVWRNSIYCATARWSCNQQLPVVIATLLSWASSLCPANSCQEQRDRSWCMCNSQKLEYIIYRL